MAFSIRRLGTGHLLGAWGAYWAGLAGVTLAPFARWVWDLNRIPGQHGSASLSIRDAGVTLTALKDNVTVYSGVAPLWQVALWIAVPPLLLWLAWLALRPAETQTATLDAQVAREALPDPARNGWGAPITPTSSASPLGGRERRER
ncbi:MAG: hypothetical protein ABI889_12720 [Gemmatimonadota bacterium]